MTMTPAEQYLLELINRARLDPLGEAGRYGIDLNQGLSPGQLDRDPRQVLAPNPELNTAAAAHSRWMLESDSFSHTGANGSTAGERMASAGYVFSGSWTWGENIAASYSTGPLTLDDEIGAHHQGLFLSPGHRVNILADAFAEIGLGQEAGLFTDGLTYNASMLTENFARTGSTVFLTGVAYTDSDRDDFYSIGEGTGGVTIRSGGTQTQSAAAGGYALGLAATGWVDAAFVLGNGTGLQFSVDMSQGNAKLDLVDGTRLQSSADLVLLTGATEATLIGTADLNLTGSSADDILRGNAGANRLFGAAGNDRLVGSAGNDHLDGGVGTDIVEYAGNSTDFAVWQNARGYTISSSAFGTDTLLNVESLAFLDQALSIAQAAQNTASSGNAGTDNTGAGQGSTEAFLQQQFGLSIHQAREWVMSKLGTPREIYDVCSRNDITSAMLAEIVQASFPEITLTGSAVNEWLNMQGLAALA